MTILLALIDCIFKKDYKDLYIGAVIIDLTLINNLFKFLNR